MPIEVSAAKICFNMCDADLLRVIKCTEAFLPDQEQGSEKDVMLRSIIAHAKNARGLVRRFQVAVGQDAKRLKESDRVKELREEIAMTKGKIEHLKSLSNPTADQLQEIGLLGTDIDALRLVIVKEEKKG